MRTRKGDGPVFVRSADGAPCENKTIRDCQCRLQVNERERQTHCEGTGWRVHEMDVCQLRMETEEMKVTAVPRLEVASFLTRWRSGQEM